MNQRYDILDAEDRNLCDGAQARVHIEIGDNGFSVCRSDHAVVGECLIEGIQHLGIAQELTEMFTGELEYAALEAQRMPRLVFG